MIKNETSNNFTNYFLETALYYAAQGYAIFPLKPRSKEPATPHGFKDATSDREQITSWWTQEPSYNTAIATGNMSGVLVIDVDGTEGEQSLIELEDKLGQLLKTVTQITPGKIKNGQHTGRGRHLIFKINGQSFSSRTGITKNVDIKADGGYIVAAPSVHPDGTGVYEFAEGLSLNDIEPAELPDTWREFLQNFERPKKQGMVSTLPPASEAIVEACRQEIACYEPAIENEGGDKQTFTVACTIFYDWGLSEAEGKPILEEYNARCVPPWNEKQLQHKIDSAINHTGDQARGWKRIDRPIEGEYFPPFGAVVLNPNRTLPSALAFRRA